MRRKTTTFFILFAHVVCALKTSVSQWHSKRRLAIKKELSSERVAALTEPTPLKTISTLIAVDVTQLYLASGAGGLLDGFWWTVFVACTIGGWLSCGQFVLCHDVLHGSADLPLKSAKARRKFRQWILFILSAPNVFGYWLYLELGHLSHHKFTGEASIEKIFDSNDLRFEDGDLFFAAHRQYVDMITNDQGPPISIARLVFKNCWRPGNSFINAFAYSMSMLFERAAVCLNDKWVAISGSNRFFFKNKPDEFHNKCATYARYTSLIQLALFLVSGPTALLYLLLAEVSWQLPFHPSSALFVFNHGIEEHRKVTLSSSYRRPLAPSTPAANCHAWPTHSVYSKKYATLFDLTCWNANYHVEHHDFPEVPLWRLPQLREEANNITRHPLYYYPPTRSPLDIIRTAFERPTIYAAWEEEQSLKARRAVVKKEEVLTSPSSSS
mmetsp:Transcript_13651/g.18197  ORF Transcript_13651/g.18197 Transcript_13651/m.18197 type:complete len:440 (-) Transcript_13651:772-2091(-)